MRRLTQTSLFVFVVVVSSFICVRSTHGASFDEDRQKTAILALIDAWNGGPVDTVRQYGAETVVLHYGGQSINTTFEELKDLIAHWRKAFPDFQMHVDEIISDGNFTAARMRYEGTHEGVWFGNEPTGKRVMVDEMMFFRFEDGLLVEAWEVDDQLTMRQQLGLIP